MSVHELQLWLIAFIEQHSPVATLMRTAWAWPIAESLHFLGLCLLVGAVGAFDLRLLGVAKQVPLRAVHRFIPVGIAGFVLNVATGLMFILTEPDQYILNRSFHMKLLFLTIAGLNAMTFYLTSWRTVFGGSEVVEVPARAKLIAAISLTAWMGVIVAGRLLTFYRPFECFPYELTWLLLPCRP